jgi:hypothetical protein
MDLPTVKEAVRSMAKATARDRQRDVQFEAPVDFVENAALKQYSAVLPVAAVVDF